MKIKQKCRINLALDADTKKNVDALQEMSGASSITEVIRRALALYHLVMDIQKNGGSIMMKNSEGETERLRIL